MPASLFRATAVAAATLVIAAACDQQARTTLPPPSNAYAKTSTNPAPAKGTCLTDDEIQAVRNEIAWQQFYNAAIQCEKNTPSFRPDYGAFRNKFRTDNEVNSAPLQRAITKHRMNVNAFKTEVANRDGASAGGNPKYCANAYDGFRWALSQQVNNISQVPPMLDFSGDMGLRVCAAGTPAGKPAAKPARK